MQTGKTEEIEDLLYMVREAYGTHAIEPYGDSEDPRSAGFKIRGIPASFSVISASRLTEQHYDIQIESSPNQDLEYVYRDRAVSSWGFLELLKIISGPREKWPEMVRR